MKDDMTVPCSGGYINIRAGAIIMKDGKFLMAGSKGSEYLYSVGGRVRFGETAEQAVIREVFEETGVMMETDRLGFIHENYFTGDSGPTKGKQIYEISFYFYMNTPDDFEPKDKSFTESGTEESLYWVDPKDDILYYPEFFRTELTGPARSVKHFVTDDR